MEPNAPTPNPDPSGLRPPPPPPHRTAVGLGPDGGDSRKFIVTKSAEGEGKFARESAGLFQYGHVIVRVEPNGRGKGPTISSEVSERAIPKQYLGSVTETLHMMLDHAYEERPVVDIIVRIVGGSWDEQSSTDLAFRMATIFAIKNAVKSAGPMPIE
jgi:elongation factor G